ncbi:MAG: OadG family protein [Synergistaceae bacterium]|jgi:sodium pump decarboxylase gamma subunit|nr:OadG family protein [Synergistaceae bacterium]
MEAQSSVVMQAVIYSCIAFSIVFIVLGGLTVVIYAMRIVTGSSTPSGPSSEVVSVPQAKVQPTGVKNQHVAAIAAAILASTQGKGRILNITPIPRQRTFSLETTRIWRTMAVVEGSSRRLAPSWKQQTD